MSHAISVTNHPALAPENVTLRRESISTRAMTLAAAGVVCGVVATIMGVAMGMQKQAMTGYLIGTMICMGLSLGGLFWTLVFTMFDSGWTAMVKRPFENLANMLPFAYGLFVVFIALEVATGGIVCSFLQNNYTDGDVLFEHKSTYFSLVFILARVVVYGLVWGWLLMKVVRPSFEQDRTGDMWITAKQRFHSSYGLLLFGFSIAFFSFDWLKAVADYRFFSTMWGVYFFAGCAFSSVAFVAIVLTRLKSHGLLKHGAVTEEHFHDIAKLMFAFTVFWAYIAYSQYFLIWYSNIPEETSFFLFRKEHWPVLTATLVFGHFLVPWYILLWRPIRRNMRVLAVVAMYMFLMHVLDIYWILRPSVDTGADVEAAFGPMYILTDAVSILAPIGVYVGWYMLKQMAARPVVALHDPRIGEALAHKNYV